MSFGITVNNDNNHSLTFSKNTLARRNEANVSVTVTVPAAVYALGSFAYVDFLLPDGTSYYKGPYDPSSGSFTFTLGSADIILQQDGRIGIQFVLRDAAVNPTVVWKSELKYALVGASADATAQALTGIPAPATFPTTFPAANVSLTDAGTYFASPDVEDALQEVGLKLTKEQLGNLMYPVGSIYVSVVATNPTTFFGGTWAAFGAGRTLVGIDSTQTEFDVVKETGGAKTHALSEAELAAHTHAQQYKAGTLGSGGNYYAVPTGGMTIAEYSDTTFDATNVITGSTGSGTAHNNLQPYIVTYMWERTA